MKKNSIKTFLSTAFSRDIIYITLFVYAVMHLGAAIPLKFGALNPFKAGVKNHDGTDVVFSKFKNKEAFFDDRIALVNIGKPDRTELISLVNSIQSYGPVAVGIDLYFSDFHKTKTDTTLRNTLRSYDNVVIIKKLGKYDEEQKTYDNLTGCDDFFCDSVQIAYSNFLAKKGDVVRVFSPSEIVNGKVVPSFAVALASHAKTDVLSQLVERNNDSELIHYRQDKEGFLLIDKSEILKGQKDLTNTFKGKIVIIGYLGADEWDESVKDKFYTPMNPKIAVRNIPDMYGVTIHANILSMLLDEDYIDKTKGWSKVFLNFLMIFLAVHLFRNIYLRVNPGYWKIVRVIQLVLFAILFLIVSGVLYFYNHKLALGIGIVGAVLSWDVVKFYENVIIRKQKFFKPRTKINT